MPAIFVCGYDSCVKGRITDEFCSYSAQDRKVYHSGRCSDNIVLEKPEHGLIDISLRKAAILFKDGMISSECLEELISS
jgi:hypothetical protein